MTDMDRCVTKTFALLDEIGTAIDRDYDGRNPTEDRLTYYGRLGDLSSVCIELEEIRNFLGGPR